MTSKTKAAKLQVVYRPLDQVTGYARNARKHSDEQVGQIAASIREFGFTNPVLIDEEGTIIAGHGRVLAATRLKLKEIPTITLAGLSEAQRRALVLADNQLAANATWDDELLKVELIDLHQGGFDLGLLGFDADQLTMVMGLNLPPSEASGEPEVERYGVMVMCDDLGHQTDVFNTLQADGYNCKALGK